jgi:hypothetical protein
VPRRRVERLSASPVLLAKRDENGRCVFSALEEKRRSK